MRGIENGIIGRRIGTLIVPSLNLFRNPPVCRGTLPRIPRQSGPGGVTHMLEGSESSVGFLRSSKVRNAENAIGQLEGLVTVLRLTQADIKPAEEALQVAKQLFAGGQYAKAFHAAKRAESLAIMLDERFGGYQQAATALRVRIQSMQRLGLRADLLEAILTRAEEKVLSGTWEEGMFVPNYVEARRLLERAEQEGRAFQHKAERASNGIFMAELAIESIGEIKGPTDPIAFVHGATPGLEGWLQDATKELGLADAEILYGRLQSEGFQSYEAEVAIRDARRLVREANYARAVEHLERALHAFARRTNAREALAKAIELTRKRVQLLQGSGLTFMPDIQEVLTRAEREFQQGNFSGSSEDLRIATVLLGQAARPAIAKK